MANTNCTLQSKNLLPNRTDVRLGLATCMACLVFSSPVVADERDFNRAHFGQNTIAVWSALNIFELQIVNQITTSIEASAEAAVDADWLLALYLIASGDVRTAAEFAEYQHKIDTFLSSTATHAPGPEQERRLGAALLAEMHAHFFLSATEDPQASGYELNQSTLSGIFHTRTYNCISSALLYSVLAEKSGLRASGAIMPSHAFVKVELANGEVVEVETTSPSGFDVIRDETFYDSEATDWFSARQLVISDYEDYRNRRFVSAIGLGLENLWSQHTAAGSMAYTDRMRLAEIKGFLQPDDYRAQHNRLIYYYREADYLRQQDDTDSLLRLYEHIEPYLQSIDILARSENALADREFQTVFHLVQAARAQALIAGGEAQAGLDLSRSLLQTLDNTLREAAAIRSGLYHALANYAGQRIAESEFLSAREAFRGLEQDCAGEHNCISALDNLYALWTGRLWQDQDWQGVVNLIHDYQTLNLDSPNTDSFSSNLESSYLNLANQAWFDEDRDAAINYLVSCQQRAHEHTRCTERLLEMRLVL